MHDTNRETSSRQKVYRYVKEGIISRAFRPGDMIYERDLAQALSVSRTPVREALQTLQDDGWLTVIPRKGSRVRPLSREEVEEVLQIRSIIASASIVLTGGRVSPAELAYLHSVIGRQKKAAEEQNSFTFMEADMEFHLALVRLTGNRRLVAITRDLLDNFLRIGIEALLLAKYSEAIDTHKEILAALERGDTEGARTLMIDHIGKTREILL